MHICRDGANSGDAEVNIVITIECDNLNEKHSIKDILFSPSSLYRSLFSLLPITLLSPSLSLPLSWCIYRLSLLPQVTPTILTSQLLSITSLKTSTYHHREFIGSNVVVM